MVYSLSLNTSDYTVKSLTMDNDTISYRAYENIVYVKNPVDTKYQMMNIYVPEAYYKGKSIGRYNAETAPIFLPNGVGGYMPGAPVIPGQDMWSGGFNAAMVALLKGCVVAAPGARGRSTQDDQGLYTGKAPACIVDLKAAVRYLRFNRNTIPGDLERIISNGTSAGGALSSLLGATGNHTDYEPYLNALGVPEERDDIFAASCYCPITNLDNADTAYEWMYDGLYDYSKVIFSIIDGQVQPTSVRDAMTSEQIRISRELKTLFPAYINSLGIKKDDGTMLTLDANGEGSFKDYVQGFVVASAQYAKNQGTDLSELPWISIEGDTVINIDFAQYVRYATRMKPAPAFDGLDVSTPENELFGTDTVNAQHFTVFAEKRSTAGGSLADEAIVKLLNPMNYIGTEGATTARYWRIRHGAVDRDTSLAIPVLLATRLKNSGFDVDFALPWGQAHGGDYDLDELFTWIQKICAS